MSSGNAWSKEDEDRIAGIVRVAERAHRRAAADRTREVHALINFVAAKAGIPRPARRAPSPVTAAGSGNGKPKPTAPRRAPTGPNLSAQQPRAPERLWSIDTMPPPETGAYEIVHELSHCGASVVYAARAGGGGENAPPRFAVKVTRPPGIWSSDEARRHVRDFLAAASLQKRVAASRPAGKGHWAPVHGEPAEIPGQGAWYATDRFARSAEDLASSQRGPIAERDLWQLVSGVIDGLEQLEQTAERPHGNLKAGNVLLAGRTGRFRAALTDPLADAAAARQLGRAADLRQLGDLIRKLVLRDTGGAGAATASLLGAPTAWAHLGHFASGWREFCGALLEGGERYPTFDDLRAAIRPLSPAVRRGKHVGAAIAAVLLIVAGSVAYHLYSHRYQPAQWEKLCDQWDWYDRTYEALKGERAKVVLGTALGDKAASPSDIALRSGTPGELRQLGRDNTPPALFAGKETIRSSLRAIDALHARLLPGPSPFWKEVDARIESIDKEPAEQNLADRLRLNRNAVVAWIESEAIPAVPATQEQGGERRPVWYQFGDLLKLGVPSGGQVSVLARIGAVNSACARVRAAATWKDVGAEATDAFLGRVVRDVQADLDKQSVKSLAEDDALVKGYESLLVGRVLDKLGAQAASRFYWKGLTGVDAVSIADLPGLKDSSPLERKYGDVVDSWIASAADYQILPAIPDAKTWEAAHPVKDMTHRLQLAREQGTADGDLTRRMDDLGREISQLQALKVGIESHTFVKKESALLNGQLDQLAGKQAKLEALLKAVEEEAQVPDQWLAAITNAQAPPDLKALDQEARFNSPAVATFWRVEKDRLIQQLPADHTKPQVAKLFADVQLKLTKTARKLDEELPVAAVDSKAPPWAKPFYDFRAERREQLLEQLRDKLLADQIPVVQLSDGLIQPLRDEWAKWQKALAEWVQLGTRLQDALDPAGGLYAITDTLPGDAQTVGQQLHDWLNKPGSRSDALSALHGSKACNDEIDSLSASLAHLTKLTAEHPDPVDVRSTLTNSKSSPAELWTAWWAAGRLAEGEQLPLKSAAATQPSELTARTAALVLAARAQDAARSATLVDRVKHDGVARWMRRAKPAGGNGTTRPNADWPSGYASVLEAAESKDDFEAGPELQKDPKAQYNLLLADVIRAAPPIAATDPKAANQANDKAERLWARFIADAPNVPLTGADLGDRDRLLALMRRDVEKTAKKAAGDLEHPVLEDHGWKRWPANADPESEQDYLSFKWGADLKDEKSPVLRFRCVQVPNGESQFVLRGTVTIEQFNFIMRRASGTKPSTTKLQLGSTGESYKLALWDSVSGDGTLHVRDTWIGTPATVNGAPIPFGRRDLMQPSQSLPVVSISTGTMQTWATLLGAHLTTLSEWEAARATEGPTFLKTSWNLRDRAWKQADDHFQRNLKGNLDATDLDPRGWQRFRSGARDAGNVWDDKLLGPAPNTAYDDGAVLPLPAEPDAEAQQSGRFGKDFFHLNGNVWQAVEVDAASEAAKLPAKTKYAVVGGSAISPPELGREMQWLSPNETQGATDIGFRISFKAPLQPPRVLLTQAIRNAGQFLHD